uniref:DNA replication regulator SLD3 n=1 Tax=Edwardsiella piscicida TaxID=1263550 RepID=A0A8F5ZAK0_EDWPI|nr:DNA replication regulator SLD3 [Edwardsiella piscicida]
MLRSSVCRCTAAMTSSISLPLFCVFSSSSRCAPASLAVCLSMSRAEDSSRVRSFCACSNRRPVIFSHSVRFTKSLSDSRFFSARASSSRRISLLIRMLRVVVFVVMAKRPVNGVFADRTQQA